MRNLWSNIPTNSRGPGHSSLLANTLTSRLDKRGVSIQDFDTWNETTLEHLGTLISVLSDSLRAFDTFLAGDAGFFISDDKDSETRVRYLQSITKCNSGLRDKLFTLNEVKNLLEETNRHKVCARTQMNELDGLVELFRVSFSYLISTDSNNPGFAVSSGDRQCQGPRPHCCCKCYCLRPPQARKVSNIQVSTPKALLATQSGRKSLPYGKHSSSFLNNLDKLRHKRRVYGAGVLRLIPPLDTRVEGHGDSFHRRRDGERVR